MLLDGNLDKNRLSLKVLWGSEPEQRVTIAVCRMVAWMTRCMAGGLSRQEHPCAWTGLRELQSRLKLRLP